MYGGETKMGVSYTKLASVVAVAAVVGGGDIPPAS